MTYAGVKLQQYSLVTPAKTKAVGNGEDPPYTLDESQWASEPVWKFWSRKKSLALDFSSA
jgi:hypothetical protein